MAERFPDDVVAKIAKSPILGIRAGTGDHRIIGVWVVVVERRVFIRSWSRKPDGWHATIVKEPRGIAEVAGVQYPVRAVQTRSERLKSAVDRAYEEKYHTPASMKYVRDLNRPPSRDTTTELVPRRAPAPRKAAPGRTRRPPSPGRAPRRRSTARS